MTTQEVLLPIFNETSLVVGKDYNLAFAPERIDPGNKMLFEDIAKVVGGITPECTEIATAFYQQFLNHVHPVSDAKTAEMTKILENTYRLVNISMVNEFRLLCGKMGIDIWEVIEAAKTKPYGFTAFYPSPKVGGHCIAIDPFYLSWKAREYNFWARFIELAGELNEQMPHYVVTNAISFLNRNNKHLNSSKVLVLGVAYKKDIGDPRESAAFDIIPNLQTLLVDLRKKYGIRNIEVKKGDEVFVMRGKFKKRVGKIVDVDLKNTKIAIENIQNTKRDGNKVNVWIHPSKVKIKILNTEDKMRLNNKETKTTGEKENAQDKK
jgi:nucleotide sugar dehydrogenase